MGRRIRASLVYGIDLGGEEGGYTFQEVYGDDEDGCGPKLDWYDEDEDSYDLADQGEERLRTAAGFTETDTQAGGYFDRRHAADLATGVQFERTGYEGGDLLLIARLPEKFGADVGDLQDIDPAVLAAAAGPEADTHLAAALQALGITPSEAKPAWLLTVYYG